MWVRLKFPSKGPYAYLKPSSVMKHNIKQESEAGNVKMAEVE